MTATHYLLAHDLGTTGNKATLFNATTGLACAAVFESYPAAYLHPNWAEEDPMDWRTAIYAGTRRLLDQAQIPASAIAAVSFSGTMNGAVFLDAAGEPTRPAMLWADQRAMAEAEHLGAACGFEAVYRRTGHRASASYTAAKALWVKRHQPEVYARTRWIVQAKDYAAMTLSGVIATDLSDASGTNLFNLEARTWADDIIQAIGLDAAMLPPVHPSATVIGQVTRKAATLTGLVAGTPVVIGAGDGACATVGSGVVGAGDAYTYIGSSAWIATALERPLYDPLMRTFTFVHPDPRLYFAVGAMQSAGGSLDWLVAAEPPGAHGLLFLPHLLGERSPHWNPLARGAFVGLSMAHGRAAVSRAVLEGVAFNLRAILDAFRAQEDIAAMRVIGGGARSAVWRQILADVYGVPVLRPQLLGEATSFGAAITAGVGVGLYDGFEVARRFVHTDQTEQPDPAHHAAYDTVYALFQDAYRALEPLFPRLNAL
ncbi:MAG: Xylulose kinase [Chloroflexi bacterium ADurb.Bin325]|nr:MAG: Xylulose kinase [Chloroflexi bacterium ADurb.Bin325]